MKETGILKHHGKTIIILALCICIPFILIWYIASHVNENIFHEQKGESLFAFAKVLDSLLVEGGYDEILLNAGMNGHVGKPLDFNEVLSVLREYLR